MNPEKALKILEEAYQIELEGFTFYKNAEKLEISNESKNIFNYFADEEMKHQFYIKEQIANIKNGNTFKIIEITKPEDEKIKNIFLDSIKTLNNSNNNIINEASVLHIGILLEKNSFNFYTNASKESEDKEEVKLFSKLAEWELTHLDILQSAYNSLREIIFADQRFSPF
jgi:rubrerythrin